MKKETHKILKRERDSSVDLQVDVCLIELCKPSEHKF